MMGGLSITLKTAHILKIVYRRCPGAWAQSVRSRYRYAEADDLDGDSII